MLKGPGQLMLCPGYSTQTKDFVRQNKQGLNFKLSSCSQTVKVVSDCNLMGINRLLYVSGRYVGANGQKSVSRSLE